MVIIYNSLLKNAESLKLKLFAESSLSRRFERAASADLGLYNGHYESHWYQITCARLHYEESNYKTNYDFKYYIRGSIFWDEA